MHARKWFCVALFAFLAGQSVAGELAPELRALIDTFSTHRRVAVGYLRTGNPELAAVEIERLREGWSKDAARLPQKLRADSSLVDALSAIKAMLDDSLIAADAGDLDKALALLERAAQPLIAWRQANGIWLFSDCILEAGAAYAPLDVYRTNSPNLTDASLVEAIRSKAAAATLALQLCENKATADLRGQPEFRRLIDGMLNSLRQVPDALRQRDRDYLHRLLIEQRSFERLLAFRFG